MDVKDVHDTPKARALIHNRLILRWLTDSDERKLLQGHARHACILRDTPSLRQ